MVILLASARAEAGVVTHLAAAPDSSTPPAITVPAGSATCGWLRISRALAELCGSLSRTGCSWADDFDRGWLRSDGLELGIELGVGMQRGPWSGSLCWRGRVGEHLPARGRLLEAWIAARYGPLELGVGRGYPCWTPAENGRLLLSHNPPPLDHIRMAAGPLHLPLVGGDLGAGGFLAYLDDPHRVVPYPLLGGMRLTWRPAEWIALEAQRTAMFGGGGRGQKLGLQDLWDIFWGHGEGAYGPPYRPSDSDHKFAWLFCFHPKKWVRTHLGIDDLELFWLYGGEDQFKNGLPTAPGRSHGIRIHTHRTLAVAFVYTSTADDDNYWYYHKIYRTGYTYRGYCLGHPMGSDARMWHGGVFARPRPEELLWVRLIRERRGYYWDGRAFFPMRTGGFWRWEVGASAPLAGSRVYASVGGSTSWGGDRNLNRPARIFARLQLDLLRARPMIALDRELVWGLWP